jgi:hypothetical protein
MDLTMAAYFPTVIFALLISSGVSFSIHPSKLRERGVPSSLVRVQAVLSAGIEEIIPSATKAPTTNTNYNDASQSDSQGQGKSQIHLLSLQWTPEDDAQKFSRVVRDTWRWKDAVLGDGRDFFVPKPRTLKALQSFLRGGVNGQNSNGVGGDVIKECVVLSNCARFEILLVTSSGVDPAPLISSMLLQQMESYRKRPIQINIPLDWAGAIDANTAAATANHDVTVTTSDPAELVQYWTHRQGVRNITDHLCRVAAGMAPRPRRPDRETVFQPFSSRDSHIMLQLKRTLDIAQDATATTATTTGSLSLSIPILLKYALQAGKASRTESKVPELQELKNYGTGNSKYCVQPPIEVSQRVTAVSECVRMCFYRASNTVY